ncbi:Mediator of RNA polymerase II transcription subunit 31 [Talaromyces atroroseus]|uniref:Mediator of RNA polymerase II transcription subunit 31 n=1 Tax=Talaromyces atroroseus TaxID=1441469 RepID=A0A1Q5Q884_TALAT|nr:Mediator of RNA polymerase II transcription subunit 31 [Talaromyces atroroseus]OKL60337.1 Mediator of RNA polymerase II transcription subunit 31 [Talaromyces atroroseus]
MDPPPPPPPQQQPPPSLTNPRFTLELEFVLSLANPYYLSHLAISFPNLLGTSTVDEKGDEDSDEAELSSSASGKEARAFHAYLAYLYSYWKTPEYAQFLTHPGATLRALRLLQEESFRRDIIRPQVIESLLATHGEDAQATTAPENEDSVEIGNGTQAS